MPKLPPLDRPLPQSNFVAPPMPKTPGPADKPTPPKTPDLLVLGFDDVPARSAGIKRDTMMPRARRPAT